MKTLSMSLLTLLLVVGRVWAGEDFRQKIYPILSTNCLPCHDENTRTSGFSVNDLQSVRAGGARHGPAVKSGQPLESPLIQILRGQIKPQLPLGRSLTEGEIATIEEGIRGEPLADCLRRAGGPATKRPALWRALGASLVGLGTLC